MATPRTNIAKDHKGSRTPAPTFPNIWAIAAGAYGMKPVAVNKIPYF
jgi:hypothetical protein